jgi:hypothetical protein
LKQSCIQVERDLKHFVQAPKYVPLEIKVPRRQLKDIGTSEMERMIEKRVHIMMAKT